MDQPLGRAVGNAVEVAESIACLRGEAGAGAEDLMEVTYALGAEMLLLAGVAKDAGAAREKLAATIRDGSALEKFRKIVVAQGGDGRVCDDPAEVLPRAKFTVEARAKRAGFVREIDAMAVALGALRLGAGRIRAEDTVDHAVGFTRLIKVGERVDVGSVLGVVHANDEAMAEETRACLEGAVQIGEEAPAAEPLIVERIG
jgi:thymidine phosphorylase